MKIKTSSVIFSENGLNVILIIKVFLKLNLLMPKISLSENSS